MQILLAHPTCTSLPAHDPSIVGGYGCQLSIPSRNTHRSSTMLIKLGCRKAVQAGHLTDLLRLYRQEKRVEKEEYV